MSLLSLLMWLTLIMLQVFTAAEYILSQVNSSHSGIPEIICPLLEATQQPHSSEEDNRLCCCDVVNWIVVKFWHFWVRFDEMEVCALSALPQCLRCWVLFSCCQIETLWVGRSGQPTGQILDELGMRLNMDSSGMTLYYYDIQRWTVISNLYRTGHQYYKQLVD